MFYVYDGTFEGFLSALAVVMRSHTGLSDPKRSFYGIVRENDISRSPLLLENLAVVNIPNIIFDFGDYIRRNFGAEMNITIYRAFLSEEEGIENAIAGYLFLARKIRKDPVDQRYEDNVKKVATAARRVLGESHAYLGLLRFRKLKADPGSFFISNPATVPGSASVLSSGHPSDSAPPPMASSEISLSPGPDSEVFVAECEPATFCLPLIAEHFVERLPNQLFVIFDRKRKIYVVHLPGGQWTMQTYNPRLDESSCYETAFESLWQKYYKTMAIPERINPKLQMSNMPKRYWKYLVEEPGEGKGCGN